LQRYSNRQFHLTVEIEIKKKEKDEKEYKKMLAGGKDVILTYKEFVELMEKLPQNIPKMTQTKDLDYILSKIFLNFYTRNKKSYKLTLNAPFDVLADTNVLNGARYHTTLELFETMVNNIEMIRNWNISLKELLEKDHTTYVSKVTF
jgi:type I restriction-modification system DNA methylase subunit